MSDKVIRAWTKVWRTCATEGCKRRTQRIINGKPRCVIHQRVESYE